MPRNLPLKSLAILLLISFAISTARADVKLPAVFGDHMALQRDVAIPVWGWADPGEKVTVTLDRQSQGATADKAGKWSVELEPMAAGGPLTLKAVGKNAVERTDDAACYACHAQGARVGQHVANRMSHRPLVHCLQCHAAPPPKPFAHVDFAVANSFTGLPTPAFGERAFPGAPPVVPHSTWMRERCLSCHGGVAGWAGLEVTHRWRANCRQCHASSAKLEQAVVARTIDLVPAFDAREP